MSLAKAIENGKHKTGSTEVIHGLARFSAKLNMHLAMEDRALYPRLMASDNKEISKTAQDFLDEMGGIKKVLEAYIFRWSVQREMKENYQDFEKETKGLIAALGQRIERENNILYPLAEKKI